MRLIDADALMGEVESVLLMYSQFNHWLTKDMYTRMKMAVRAMPTVDAVPVVRCKNCGAYQTKDVPFPRCRITGRMKGTDDYCSSGYTEDGGSND